MIPDPEITTEIYLAAILAELRRIGDLLEEPQPVQEDGEVDLVEPNYYFKKQDYDR